MGKYIDKSALVAEIEKRFDEYSSSILKHYDACTEARASELGKILIILNSLEVKEVDLEKKIKWKPITEVPTEHWANNYAISPLYLVKCGEKNGIAILGYTNYSFATKSWMGCHRATEPGIHKVTEWTDIKL